MVKIYAGGHLATVVVATDAAGRVGVKGTGNLAHANPEFSMADRHNCKDKRNGGQVRCHANTCQ